MAIGAIGGILSGLSSIVGAIGAMQGQKYEAAKARVAARVGRVQADQIDAAYRDELSSTLANIQAIRASTGVGGDSPTTLALQEASEKTSDRNRSRDVASRKIQANLDEAEGRFLKSSAKFSLFGGIAKSLPYFFGQ